VTDAPKALRFGAAAIAGALSAIGSHGAVAASMLSRARRFFFASASASWARLPKRVAAAANSNRVWGLVARVAR
jgi:hypothetical protein